MNLALLGLLGIAGTTTGLISATDAKQQAIAEANRARLAEEAARESEEAARQAEAEARTNLEKSERLAGELSASMAKLSENASRLAAQRARTLIEQDRKPEGLHWLSRALELAPAGETPLSTEIRTTMSVVADTLPRPRFVIPCAGHQVFELTTMSPDGSRIVQLVSTDPPAAPQALEARVLDAATGELVTSIAVPHATSWVGFAANGRSVCSFDGERLRRWSDKTGSPIGSGHDLSQYRTALPTMMNRERLRSMPAEIRDAFLARVGPRIRGVGADGKKICKPGTSMSSKSRKIGASTLGGRPRVTVWDFGTGQSRVVPLRLTRIGPRIQPSATVSAVTFAPDGKSLILCERTSDGPKLSMWDTTTTQRLSPSIPMPAATRLLECSSDGAWVAAAKKCWSSIHPTRPDCWNRSHCSYRPERPTKPERPSRVR